ncbi:MAG: hypothetical protein VB913_05980 [Rhodospirillales bacterium]
MSLINTSLSVNTSVSGVPSIAAALKIQLLQSQKLRELQELLNTQYSDKSVNALALERYAAEVNAGAVQSLGHQRDETNTAYNKSPDAAQPNPNTTAETAFNAQEITQLKFSSAAPHSVATANEAAKAYQAAEAISSSILRTNLNSGVLIIGPISEVDLEV